MKSFLKVLNLLVLVLLISTHTLSAQGQRKSSGNQKRTSIKPGRQSATVNNGTTIIGSPLQPVDVPETGCGEIWHHFNKYGGGKNVVNAATDISFTWYKAPPFDDGSSVIIDPVFPGNAPEIVIVIDSVRVDNRAISPDKSVFSVKQGDVISDKSNDVKLINDLRNSTFNIDVTTNSAYIQNPSGINVVNLQFFDGGKTGEMWGRTKYNRNTYYVKMQWLNWKQEGNKYTRCH